MILVAGDILIPLGQAAAIILGIYLLINILVGVAFAVIFMFAFRWLSEKVALIKKLRPTIESMNEAIKHPVDTASGETAESSNKLVQVVHSVQAIHIPEKVEGAQNKIEAVEKRIDQGTDRVAEVVIEVRARTVQVQGMLKAFFLPGLAKKRVPQLPAPLVPLQITAPGANSDEKAAQLVSVGDGSTGNAPRA